MSSVLGKIFGGKKALCPKESAARERHAKQLLYPNGVTTPELDPNRVRVVVFRDERGVKTPLFDSQINCEPEGEEQRCTRSLCDMRSSERLEQSFTSSCSIPPSSSQSAGWSENTTAKTRRAHFIRRPSTDSELLGEMMFGSMPMKVVGSTVKVHYIRSTDQLMLTKVFSFKKRPIQSCSLNDFSDSCSLAEETPRSPFRSSPVPKNQSLSNPRGTSPEYCKIRSSSLSVPASRPNSSQSSHSTRSPSPYTHSPPSPHTLAPPISSSLTRRIQRSRSTSMENASELYRRVLKPLDQQPSSQKGRKYAIGVIISLSEMTKPDISQFQDYLFSHFTLIDAHLEQLKEGIEEACQCRGTTFTQMIAKAYKSFLDDFLLLYKAPRIESPVWLNLVTSADRRRTVCIQFMEELASAIVELDTKETRFFLSSLLTAVLSHHPAWLFTVTQQNNDGRHSKMASKSLAVLAESHPYNPLWAQLGDLFGAVSNPLKIARTVVTGQTVSVVCRLVYLLTYFIRCSEVQPGLDKQDSAFHVFSSEPISMSHDASHDPILIPQLEDSDKFESRASSVTVVSEHERHFVSPVSIGRETPVIKPHPFGFKTAPVSIVSSSDGYRKSSECSSYGDSITGLTSNKKSLSRSSDLSTTSACSSNKNSPLLSGVGARQHHFATPTSDHMITKCIDTPSNVFGERGNSLVTCDMDSRESSPKPAYYNCYYGNASMCAVVPTCESMGQCPIDDGFLTFDPSRKPSQLKKITTPLHRHVNHQSSTGKRNKQSLNESVSSEAAQIHHSLHQQAFVGTLPDHTHQQSSPTHQHNSCGSVDSGYDQSWAASSLTGSSKFTESLPSSTVASTDDKYNSTSMIDACCLSPDLLGVGVSEMGGVKPRSNSCDTYQMQQTVSSNGFCKSTDEFCKLNDSDDFPTTVHTSHTPSLPVIISTTPTFRSDTSFPPSPGTCGTGAYIKQHSPTPNIKSQQGRIKRGFRTVNDQKLKQQRTVLTGSGNQISEERSSLTHLQVEMQSSSDSSLSTLQGSYPGVQKNQPSSLQPNSQIKTPSRVNGLYNGSLYNHQSSHSFPGHVTTHPSYVTATHTPERTPSPLTIQSTSTANNILNSAPSQFQTQPHPQGHAHAFTTPTSSRDTYTPSSLRTYLDSQSLVSDADSGRCTKTWSQADVDTCSQDSVALSQISESSIYSEFSDDPLLCSEGVHNNQNGRSQENGVLMKGADPLSPVDVELSLSAKYLQIHHANPSLLHEKLSSQIERPEMLQRFTDVELPGLDDFTLELPSEHWHDNDYHGDKESGTSRQCRRDFGHSLFVGHHPTYLPDFVLHGTSEVADINLQDKLVRDLGSMVKHSIIDEPIDYGVGIIGDTDLWNVKLLTASKSVQTNDVVISSSGVQFSRFIRQLLSSLKSMHEMRMPPEFCLSYLEDQLCTLSQRSTMLANNLMAYGSNADLTEILPKSMDVLSIHKSDRPLLLALAAVNCPDCDISAQLNHHYLVHQNLV